MIKHTAERGRGRLTIIPLAELLCYLGVVRPTHDADLHFPPQSLEKLIQLWVDFLQITGNILHVKKHHYMERTEYNGDNCRIGLCVTVMWNRFPIIPTYGRKTLELHTRETCVM